MSEFQPPTPIDSSHNVDSFDCGKDSLNEFLKNDAMAKQNAKLSRTYVVTRNLQVAGYYTLAYISVSQDEAPKKFGRGMPRGIPAILLARLAVDLGAQKLGLGGSMFADSLRRTWAVMENGAAPVRLFVVDAIDDETKAFYERFDMVPSPQNPMRLFLVYKTIASLLSNAADA